MELLPVLVLTILGLAGVVNAYTCTANSCKFNGTCTSSGICKCPSFRPTQDCSIQPGLYVILNRRGCQIANSQDCETGMSWDTSFFSHPHAVLQKSQMVVWEIKGQGGNTYEIRSKAGCPSGKYCNAGLSYDTPMMNIFGWNTKPTISVENGDPVSWSITPKRQYWQIINTYGCKTGGKYCNWGISWLAPTKPGAHPQAILDKDGGAMFDFIPIGLNTNEFASQSKKK